MTLAALASASTAFAVTYEATPSFCDGGVVHDYMAPFGRMPKLHTPPASGRIGFGPKRLRLQKLPALVAREGTVGYKLFLRGSRQTARLDWDVKTTLTRVNWRGEVIGLEGQTHRHITEVARDRGAGVDFPLDGRPGAYRITIVVSSDSGKKLGGYGFYLRLLAPTQNAKLSLNASSYRPERTVFARVDNFGTASALYGASYRIEKLVGTTWTLAPESPHIFILPAYLTGPGLAASECSSFWIPTGMPAGQYRMSKEVEFGTSLSPGEREGRVTLSAEFSILPY